MKRLIIILLLLMPVLLSAQPGGGGPPVPGGEPVPISGVEWLLVAGGLLGVRRFYKEFKGRR